jgi:hypothetical protein
VTGVLFEKVDVRLGESTRKIASVDALLRLAMSRALEGDYKFLTAVLSFIRLSGLPVDADEKAVAATDLTADDAKILNGFFERQRSRETQTNQSPAPDNRQQNIQMLKRNEKDT